MSMNTKGELYAEILRETEHGFTDADAIAEKLDDGRVYEEIGEELSNVVAWIPFSSDDSVLEINGGCGVITKHIALKCKNIDTLVFEDDRLRVNKAINVSYTNINYLSELADEKIYDAIIIYALKCTKEEDIKSLYRRYIEYSTRHLSKTGSIYIIFENRFGLENWNGKGRSKGRFISLFDDDGEFISRKDVLKLLSNDSFRISEYYPYPNHKYMRILYSKERLPKKGELLKYYYDNFSYSNWELFDERKVYDRLIEEESFDFFSNSYLIRATRNPTEETNIIYAKYSTDRDRRFRISTEIAEDDTGLFCVKSPLNDASVGHIKNIKNAEKKLKSRFSDKVVIVESEQVGNDIVSPFVDGVLLQSILEECYKRRDEKRIVEIVDHYADIIYTGCKEERFVPDVRFKEVFGDVRLEGIYKISDITDMDLNFDNIIVNDKWNVIDYEWFFDFPIPQKYILYRGLKYWKYAMSDRIIYSWEKWMRHFKISAHEESCFIEMEKAFQQYVYGKTVGFGRISEKYKRKSYTLNEISGAINQQNVLLDKVDRLTELVKRDESLLSNSIRYRSKRESAMNVRGNLDLLKMDEYTITVRGWAFIEGFKHNESDTYTLLVKKNDTGEIFTLGTLDKELREDVSGAFDTAVNIYNSGFTGTFNNEIGMTDDKVYSIGVQLHNDRVKADMQIWF